MVLCLLQTISESELQVVKHTLDKFNVENDKHLYTGPEQDNQGLGQELQMSFDNPLTEETFDADETKYRARAKREVALRAESNSLFNQLDRNGDGALSRQEIQKGLVVIEQSTGLKLAGKKAKEAFSYLSVSGRDGQVRPRPSFYCAGLQITERISSSTALLRRAIRAI